MKQETFNLTKQGFQDLETWLRKELNRLNQTIRQASSFTMFTEKDKELNLRTPYTKIIIEEDNVELPLKLPEDKRVHLVSIVGKNFKVSFSKISAPASIMFSNDITSATMRTHTFIIYRDNTVIKL